MQEANINEENVFKKVFKYYKSRKPPPCLDAVLNPHNPDHSQHFSRVTNEVSNCDLYEVSCRPGLAILPGWLDKNEQLDWAGRCLASYSSTSNAMGTTRKRTVNVLFRTNVWQLLTHWYVQIQLSPITIN